MAGAMVIRNVEVDGHGGVDVRLEGGRIAEVGAGLARVANEVDGRGGALIPGLVDHHIHLLALAARAGSAALEGVADRAGLAAVLAAAAAAAPTGGWLRATGYHERIAGDLDRRVLDAIVPDKPLRVQHQTGSLWVLNSLALAAVLDGEPPPFVERDASGAPTGRIWRGDAWLRARLGSHPPDLGPVGRTLAACGVTAVTDASATTDASAAAYLVAARLPQRLTLMSHGPLVAPDDGAFAMGPLKILLDDHALPDLDAMTADIARARAEGRAVAVHCVTAGELAITLAAFEAAGARPGDRIEHGGVIPPDAIPTLRDLRLTVVTQPAFVFERGDRYLAEVDPAEQNDLYRCASLIAAGVPVAASSDAPYASPDPWSGIAAAVRRRTRAGLPIGEAERVDPAAALALYLADPADPGGPPRRVTRGAAADLCLLDAPLSEILGDPQAGRVGMTLVAGQVVHAAL